jgi:hypothetical protein
MLGILAGSACAYVLCLWDRLQERRNKLRALFVLLCLGCTFAIGQAQSGSPPARADLPRIVLNDPPTMDDIIGAIGSTVTQNLEALTKNVDLHDFGNAVTAFFVAALLVWSSVKTMASGRGLPDLLGEWVPIFVSLGMVTLFMDPSAGKLIVSTMDGIASAIGGANMSSLDSAIRAGAEPIFSAMSSVISQPSVVSATKETGHWYDGGWVAALAASAASMLMGVIAKLAAGFCLLMAGVGMVANIVMAFISVNLVLALAPVMVPFLMFKPLEWIFNSWLKFLLGACMLKIVLAFLINVVASLLSGMNQLTIKVATDTKLAPLEALQVDILLLGMMMVFSLLATLLMAQAPKIADGLLSGNATGAGFAGIKAVTGGAAGGFVGATSGKASSAARGVAQVGRNYLSGRAGKRDGERGLQKSLKYRDPRAAAAYAQAYRKHFNPEPPTPPK